MLRMSATCTTASQDNGSGPNDSCGGEFDFGGTDTVPPSREGGALDTPSGVYLTDPSAQQTYIVVHDTTGQPLTAATNPQWKVGDTYPLWLYFPAPPPSLRSITVELPGEAATLPSVPIT